MKKVGIGLPSLLYAEVKTLSKSNECLWKQKSDRRNVFWQ